jgi:hypothetical protein
MTNLIQKLVLLIFLIICMLSFQSCGNNTEYRYLNQPFEGTYLMDNNSAIEMITGEDGEVTILTAGQLLVSINPKNETFGTHPKLNKTGLEPVAGVISFVKDMNYTSGMDLEEDVNGANIRGKRMTDVLIQQLPGDRIRITIKIYSDRIKNNPNFIVAVRVFESR